jgi:5-methylcytosine-specific restriction endonuclease McrA
MTLGAPTVEKLRRAQDLLRHAIPDGDPAAIVDRALTLLLDRVARTKLAATDRPRSTRPASHARSRHVPAAVRRAVWARDGGRCTFVGTEGRCGETGFDELHRLEPYALGGATTAEGMALRCRRTTCTKRSASSTFSSMQPRLPE